MTLDGELVNLTRTEYDILHLLMENPGKVFSPAQIYEQVWKEDAFGTENTVAVHIRHLRENWSMIRQNQGMLRLCGEEGTRLKTNRARPYKLPR